VATNTRRHVDVLTAGLAILGASTWIAARAVKHGGADPVVWGIAWTVGALLAGHVARRVIALDITQTVIAAAAASALLVGVWIERFDVEFSVFSLGPSGLAALGAVLGALVPARVIRVKAETLLVIAVAACGHGAMQLAASGISLVEPNAYAAGLLVGAGLGTVLAAFATGARVQECALAMAAIGASSFTRGGRDEMLDLLQNALLGAAIGAAGGWIGGRLRARLAKAEIPPAQLR
jgi:hypothetical protein